ncbi:MAG TPA: alpha-2-macroglobulin family protein, partial [Blastocatellia bacterium]
SVKTPDVDGKKKTFRLGEKVQVDIQADYYFGGGVADAKVDVVVYQNFFQHSWNPPREYSWYYDEIYARPNYGGGQIVKRETLKTDATGKAVLTFDTPRGSGQDFEYRVEARVTDSSRREVVSTNAVRVTRQRYYVYPWTDHNLYHPQDKVAVKIRALDANDQPVEAEGRVKLTRDTWLEVWLDPNGREVKGGELKRLRENGRAFPPAVKEGERPWQLKFQGYEHEDILTQSAKTNAAGEAEIDFTPSREGYYRLAWAGRDDAVSITGETTVWVATNSTDNLGYYQGGLEIVVDKDTFQTGRTAPVMLVAPASDRYVLFSVEGGNLFNYQLVHMTGNVKLIELPVEDSYAPNIFLSANMVSDRRFYDDTKQVIVPPTNHFLGVNVKCDRQEYQPGDEGTIDVTTVDNNGKPIAAEVALGLVDDAVHYIQQDYAADPRQFFYGEMRSLQVNTTSTFQLKSFTKLVAGKNEQLLDEEQLKAMGASGQGAFTLGGVGVQSALRSSAAVVISAPSGFSTDGAVSENRPLNGRAADSLAALDSNGLFRNANAAPERKDWLEAGKGAPQQPAVQVRNDFRSTAIWRPDVVTDASGKATVKFKFPDSVTTWSADVRAATAGSDFGTATASARTKKSLIVRLEAPRFFVAGDQVTISAVINNNTDQPLKVDSSLNAEGLDVAGLDKSGSADPVVEVPPNGEKRVDWTASATHSGPVNLKVIARAGQYSDAMESNYAVYEHGIEKLISQSGKLSADRVKFDVNLPAQRKPESTTMTVQVAGSLAVTMLDALPYLIDYPYGCTEQTMSRFLPAAITAKTLKDLGLKPESIAGRMFGGIVQSTAAQTHPGGKRDPAQLDEITTSSLERLYDFQHADGGWGWWKEGPSDNFMTAYVVWGLALAREAGISVNSDTLNRAADYLDKALVDEKDSYDVQAWMLHALAEVQRVEKKGQPSKFQAAAFENLWGNRDRLNAYTRALLALAASDFKYTDRAQILIRNLHDGVVIDNHPDSSVVTPHSRSTGLAMATAHWGNDGIYWRWSDGGVEATSFALRAILAIDPKNDLVGPVTNWLIKNRRGSQWSNTRDTAISVLALNDYLRQSGELKAEADYELQVNGQTIATKSITPASVLDAPSQFAIDPKVVRSGNNEIALVRTRGTSPLYYSATATFFSQEEPITAAGNEIFVRRDYYKLVAQPTLLKGFVYSRELLTDGKPVSSGDRVEEVITIESKNNYEYLLFEDLKPAGLESVELRSGGQVYARELKSSGVEKRFLPAADPTANAAGSGAGLDSSAIAARSSAGGPGAARTGLALLPVSAPVAAVRSINQSGATKVGMVGPPDRADYTGRSHWVYQELRERKVALFIDKLEQGVWEIRYEMRAEAPGTFHALPVTGQAMYTPEIRCNGQEAKIKVIDKK